MDVVREFHTAAVRLHVLHHAVAGEVHGAWMIHELRHHGHRIGPGALYPLLHRMEQAGLLTSEHQVVDGHRRRPYRATAQGRAALTACQQALAELAAEVLPAPPTDGVATEGQQPAAAHNTARNDPHG